MSVDYLSRGERTRQDIIQAAHDLFIRQGYHGTSMRQIALKAGIALGGVYNHFQGGKEQVFREVFLTYHPYQDVLPAMMSAQGNNVERFVRDAFDRILMALQDRPYFMNLMFIEIVEFKSAHVHELFSQLVPQEMEIVRRFQEANLERLRPIPTWMLLRAFFGLLFSYYLTELIFAAQAPLEFREGAIDYLIDIFLHGVLQDGDIRAEIH
jgi:AcrR family transcriptional regulator